MSVTSSHYSILSEMRSCFACSTNSSFLVDEIKHMHENLDAIYIMHDTPVQERDANTLNFIWPKHTNSQTRAEINKLLFNFVSMLDADNFKI